ncbi:hypothetical protein FB451DRAFT_551000 [Mycena latifolia]|nr:hypothetical protein FB451DRAFT_551000 [Mycena latifolia]
MTDGPTTLWHSPRDGRVSSQSGLDGLQPGPSRRASRGFFSLFSSSKGQQKSQAPPQVMRSHYTKPSFPSSQDLPARFDAISLTSPSQRASDPAFSDPAFSRDPSVNPAHPFVATPRRDFIRTSAPADPPRSLVPVSFEHTIRQQPSVSPTTNDTRETKGNFVAQYDTNYNYSSFASNSSLALPPSNDSVASSPMSPSSSSSFLSHLPTPVGMPPESLEAREDPPSLVTSPVAETSDGIGSADDKMRPMSPPPEYEVIASRPFTVRTDSAPELRHIEPPGLPHRSATAPIPAAPPTAPRRPNERRPQAYDLDRIDELDESNPLGVALHHEGPFQAIASVLKAPSPLGNQSMPSQMRTAKVPKPGYSGGSLGISPGQVLPRNFPYYQPVQPAFRQEYNDPPQASTSYLPQMQHEQRNVRAPPGFGQEGAWSQSFPSQPPPLAQPEHPSYNARGPHNPPPHLRSPVQPAHPSYDARLSYTPSPQPPLPMQPANALYDPRGPHIPPRTQYDPVDDPSEDSAPQNVNPYHSEIHQQPSGHHSSFSSEDNSAAYGGIEEDLTPKRDRRSAPPAPTAPQAQMDPYFAQNGGPNGFPPRRHTAQPGFMAPLDPRVFNDSNQHNAGQNLSTIRHSPNVEPMGGFIDPRVLQNRDQFSVGQNLSGIRHSPNGQRTTEFTDSRLQQQQPYPAPPIVDYNHSPQAGSHARPDEHDRRRPASYLPQPTIQQPPPPNFNRSSYQQAQVGQHPMAEYDPGRRASHQSVLPPPAGAAPVDLGRQQFERNTYQQVIQDREQTLAPSVVSSVNSRRGPQPQHVPKHLVMPTPLQHNSQLQQPSPAQSYPAGHYPSKPQQQVRFDTSQAQPTRAETIQMVQDGGRHLLRKRSSVVPAAPTTNNVMPRKTPPVTRTRSYMEPPPTVPETPVARPVQQEKKRPKRLLSKRRTDV